MARWKLTEPHYLLLEEETRWEYVEVERVTGRPKRTQFVVPRYLNPLDPMDWTVTRLKNEDGDIIVCNGTNPGAGDLIYKGVVTPGMLPLDDEAKEISAQFEWTPTQGLDPESQNSSYTQQLLSGLIDKITDVKDKTAAAPTNPGIDALVATLGQMVQQNQLLINKMLEKEAIEQELKHPTPTRPPRAAQGAQARGL